MFVSKLFGKRKSIVEKARDEFPNAENDLVAVDLYSQKLYREAQKLPRGKAFLKKASEYLEAREEYYQIRNRFYQLKMDPNLSGEN